MDHSTGFDIVANSVANILLDQITNYKQLNKQNNKYIGDGIEFKYQKKYIVKILAYLYKLDYRQPLAECLIKAKTDFNKAMKAKYKCLYRCKL